MTAQHRARIETRERTVNETETTTTETAATPKEVRAWAKANGHNIGDRGRVSQAIKDAFTAATDRQVA
ncbi:Lsr2 protein [Micromonospora echinospora]|uniref:Lsr2 protein n=1 Tax=Micromonospora echinospora TaxID=1877 RepID=A0A1C5ABB2_MICEC|nr:histone-like nucleoid-structuring protein Lsr2 [Micromonospora echinospora]SCF42495.1 Lsr2 protein [Micromonospora echinospora]